MVEPHSSTFRVITTNVLGVWIFRKFTVIRNISRIFHWSDSVWGRILTCPNLRESECWVQLPIYNYRVSQKIVHLLKNAVFFFDFETMSMKLSHYVDFMWIHVQCISALKNSIGLHDPSFQGNVCLLADGIWNLLWNISFQLLNYHTMLFFRSFDDFSFKFAKG